jgi:preprotein translocase subunit YajC
METGLIFIGVLGVLLFGIYVFFIIKTSRDDQKNRNNHRIKGNGQL